MKRRRPMVGPPPFPGTPTPLGAAAQEIRTLRTYVEVGPDQGIRVRLYRLTLLSRALWDSAFLAFRVIGFDPSTRLGEALINDACRQTRGYWFHRTFLSVAPLSGHPGPERLLCAPPSPTIRHFGERTGQQPCWGPMRHRSHEKRVNGAGSRSGALPRARPVRRRENARSARRPRRCPIPRGRSGAPPRAPGGRSATLSAGR